MNAPHSALLASAAALFLSLGLGSASAGSYGDGAWNDSGRETYGASRSDPRHYGETDRRAYHDVARPDNVYRSQGSIVIIARRDTDDRNAANGGIAFRGIDEYDGGGYTIDRNAGGQPALRRSGPKIIDVETARLDRRPIGASGIDVVYSGGAKIIRIAPGYRASRTGGAQTVAGLQADAAGERQSALARANDRQPWSAGWLAVCTHRHRSFDPALGTYVAADGKVRFCSAE